MYATVDNLRAEGVTEAQASAERLALLIDEASWLIDRICGCWFEPRTLTRVFGGRGTPTIELAVPVIRVDRMTVGGSDWHIDAERLHIVAAPQWPESSRITLKHGRVFTLGEGNVEVEGAWGYVEPGDTALGRTPLEIRRACMLLVLRWLAPLTDEASFEARTRWRLLEERTRDQAYRLAEIGTNASMTGDPEVDAIVARYRRPMALGAV